MARTQPGQAFSCPEGNCAAGHKAPRWASDRGQVPPPPLPDAARRTLGHRGCVMWGSFTPSLPETKHPGWVDGKGPRPGTTPWGSGDSGS